MTALVSIIIPTCDRPDRLVRALDSVAAQTYADLEAVVVNDGSASLRAQLQAHPLGARIRLIEDGGGRRGVSAARNTGLRAATGEYIAYLDDDDRYLPDHVAALVQTLDAADAMVAYADAARVTVRNGTEIRDVPYARDPDPGQLLVANHIPMLCLMHRRACLEAVPGFDAGLHTHEDWDFMLRLSARYPFVRCARVTAEFYREYGADHATVSRRPEFLASLEDIYRRYPLPESRLALQRQRDKQIRLLRAELDGGWRFRLRLWVYELVRVRLLGPYGALRRLRGGQSDRERAA
jgi:glycosyltransferase involved in cell wall biosynthesis